MKNQKCILAALAALSVLTAATSVTAFAGEETTVPESNAPEIVTEVAEIPEIAVDSDAETEEITELDAETIADAEIVEDAEDEEETIADAEIVEDAEENHKHYGFRKWDCEDWCNFASWLGGAGWRCGRDQMPNVSEESENTAVEEDAETEVEAETTYIQEWYDNRFDWNQFDENGEETPEDADEQSAEDDTQEDSDYWKWDCWYVQDENAGRTDYECKDWHNFDWSECETFTEEEQPSELTEEATETETEEEQEAEDVEKEFTAPKHEHKNWWGFWDESEESASDEEEQPSELTEEATKAETEEEQDAEDVEKEFTAPKHENKNWWGFWDETEESASDEEEQPSELTEEDAETEIEEEQEQNADEEEETSFVDWMFDEYFKNNHFNKTKDATPAEDANEETTELTEEDTTETIYVLDVQ